MMKMIFITILSWILRLQDLDTEKNYIYQDFSPYSGKQLLHQSPRIESEWFKELQFAFADKQLNLTTTPRGPVIEDIKTGNIRAFTYASTSDRGKIQALVLAAMEFNIPKQKVEKIIQKAGYTLKSLGITWNL